MTRRQIRELVILLAVVVAGVLLGMAVRTWTGGRSAQSTLAGVASPGTASGSASSGFAPLPDDRVVARLDGEDVTGATLNRYVAFNLGAVGLDAAALPAAQLNFAYRQSLDQMVEERVVARYAKEQGIEVSPEEIEETLAEARQDYESDEAFEKDLTEVLHVNRAELKEFLRNLLLKQKVVDTFEPAEPVTEDEVIRELADLQEQMKHHPGGPVDVTSDFVRSTLETRARRRAYEAWLSGQVETVDLEILEPSLKVPPVPGDDEGADS